MKPKPDAIDISTIYEIGKDYKNKQIRSFFYELYLTGARFSELVSIKPVAREFKEVDGKKFLYITLKNMKNRSQKTKSIPILYEGIQKKMIDFILSFSEYLDKNVIIYDRYYNFEATKPYKHRNGLCWNDFSKLKINVKATKDGTRIYLEDFKIHAHYLRHCRATHYVLLGLSDEQIRRLLGWTDSRMMNTYIHLRTDDIAKAMIKKGE